MDKIINNRNLTIINFIIVSYFILLWLVNYYQIKHVLVGVFGQLLTIPFFGAQVVFTFIGIWFLFKNKIKPFNIISLLILVTCTIYTVGSFF